MDRSFTCPILQLQCAAAAVVVALTGLAPLHAQNLEWARAFGGTTQDKGLSIAVDAMGNVYTAGTFTGVVDMDPGPGVSNLTASANADHFIQKLDPSGDFVWAVQFGGASALSFIGSSVAVDPSGNVLLAGSFTNTVDFDPGPGTTNLTSAGNNDVFVVKLDGAGGLIWARSWGGASGNGDVLYGLAVDAAGNVITAGTFWGTADFDPGLGSFNLTDATGGDMFVQKMDANGEFLWAKSFGGVSGSQPNSVQVDQAGNVLVAGQFQGSVDFDPGAGNEVLASAGGYDAFIQKLDAAGGFLWALRIGGSSTDTGNAIALDGSGNVLATGSFFGFVDLDPGVTADTLYSGGDVACYVLKLASDGSYQWGRSLGKVDTDAIMVDADGVVYTSGDFSQSVDVDPGAGTYFLDSEGISDLFIQAMDASGTFLWAQQFGGSLEDMAGLATAQNASGDIFMTGSFQGTVDLDPGPGTNNIVTTGLRDVLVLKLGGSAAGVSDPHIERGLSVFPNPASDRVLIAVDDALLGQRAVIELHDATGRRVLAVQHVPLTPLTAVELPAELREGVYVLMLRADGHSPRAARVVVKR